MRRASDVNDEMVRRAPAMGGISTGEHRIGSGELDHLASEAGPALDVVRAVKAAKDPAGVLNPGKIIRG